MHFFNLSFVKNFQDFEKFSIFLDFWTFLQLLHFFQTFNLSFVKIFNFLYIFEVFAFFSVRPSIWVLSRFCNIFKFLYIFWGFFNAFISGVYFSSDFWTILAILFQNFKIFQDQLFPTFEVFWGFFNAFISGFLAYPFGPCHLQATIHVFHIWHTWNPKTKQNEESCQNNSTINPLINPLIT